MSDDLSFWEQALVWVVAVSLGCGAWHVIMLPFALLESLSLRNKLMRRELDQS